MCVVSSEPFHESNCQKLCDTTGAVSSHSNVVMYVCEQNPQCGNEKLPTVIQAVLKDLKNHA